MWANPLFPTDLFIFTEEILNGKLHFLCSGNDNHAMKQTLHKNWGFGHIYWRNP